MKTTRPWDSEMSRKDYEIVAAVIAQFVANDSQRALLALELGYKFREGNSKFDMDKWLKACNCGNPDNFITPNEMGKGTHY